MRSLEAIASDLLKAALEGPAYGGIVGGVTRIELARLAVEHITTCPRCGAEAFVNIDCFVCEVAGQLQDDKEPPLELPEWIHMF